MVALNEQLLNGPDAVEQVTGEPPCYSTFLRWTKLGVLTPAGERIRLEFVKCGCKRKTTVGAVRRFVAAASIASGAEA